MRRSDFARQISALGREPVASEVVMRSMTEQGYAIREAASGWILEMTKADGFPTILAGASAIRSMVKEGRLLAEGLDGSRVARFPSYPKVREISDEDLFYDIKEAVTVARQGWPFSRKRLRELLREQTRRGRRGGRDRQALSV